MCFLAIFTSHFTHSYLTFIGQLCLGKDRLYVLSSVIYPSIGSFFDRSLINIDVLLPHKLTILDNPLECIPPSKRYAANRTYPVL